MREENIAAVLAVLGATTLLALKWAGVDLSLTLVSAPLWISGAALMLVAGVGIPLLIAILRKVAH